MKSLWTALTIVLLSVGVAEANGLKDAPFTWTGFYAGAHAGYAWGDASHEQTNGGMVPGPYEYDLDGALAGVSIGHNWQFNQVVVGIEAEAGYMDLDGEGRIASSAPGHYQALDVSAGMYGLLAARVGFAWDRSLVYAKGGYAYTDMDAGQKTTKPGFVTHRSEALQGFVYGAGLEHALSDRISIKGEWLRFDFDSVSGDQESLTDIPIGFKYTNSTDVEIDTFKLGVNFRF
jgi:outer membrane immunogenic protein